MALAFEQQPKESDKAFAAFSVYLSQGPERSLAKTAAKLGRSKVMMEKCSKLLGWPSRVQAHGAYLAAVERQATDALVRGKAAEWVTRQQSVREQEQELHEKVHCCGEAGAGGVHGA